MSSHLTYCDFKSIISEVDNLKEDTVLVVVDHNLWDTYQENLSFEKNLTNKKVHIFKSPDGEKTKNFQDLEACLEFFISKNIHRKSHLIAIGGGATTDFAGLVATLLLRGIKWSAVPTTLLGMIDAAIGGKTAVNSTRGKNLIGSFLLPENIWINNSFLETLPEVEMMSGKGELLKYAFLNEEIYKKTSDSDYNLDELIILCAKYKTKIVNDDLKESGQRKILNLGHTLGHGIEKVFNTSHGEAVLWGMALIIMNFSSNSDELLRKLKIVKDNIGWMKNDPPWLNKVFPVEKIMNFVIKDKKSQSTGSVDMILINEIGKPVIETKSFKDIEKTLIEKADELKRFTFESYS